MTGSSPARRTNFETKMTQLTPNQFKALKVLSLMAQSDVPTSTLIAARVGICASAMRASIARLQQMQIPGSGELVTITQEQDKSNRYTNYYHITQDGLNFMALNEPAVEDAMQKKNNRGAYAKQTAAFEALNIVGPRCYVNASITKTYRPSAWQPARRDADDNQQYRSLGL